jgi:hypothetical protein
MRRYRPPQDALDLVVWADPVRFDFDAWKAAGADYDTIVRIQKQLNMFASMQPGWYRFALHQMTFLPMSCFRTRQAYSLWRSYLDTAWERAIHQTPDAAVIHALGEFGYEVSTREARQRGEARAAKKAGRLREKAQKLQKKFDATDAAIDAVFATAQALASQEDKRRCTG